MRLPVTSPGKSTRTDILEPLNDICMPAGTNKGIQKGNEDSLIFVLAGASFYCPRGCVTECVFPWLGVTHAPLSRLGSIRHDLGNGAHGQYKLGTSQYKVGACQLRL